MLENHASTEQCDLPQTTLNTYYIFIYWVTDKYFFHCYYCHLSLGKHFLLFDYMLEGECWNILYILYLIPLAYLSIDTSDHSYL